MELVRGGGTGEAASGLHFFDPNHKENIKGKRKVFLSFSLYELNLCKFCCLTAGEKNQSSLASFLCVSVLL